MVPNIVIHVFIHKLKKIYEKGNLKNDVNWEHVMQKINFSKFVKIWRKIQSKAEHYMDDKK